ncbi:hypothetical protein KIN20_025361 [Parelaphostrongylus tenuis]|uniref:Uncharacterized protein n=1 Tax=Parelaphostrongylus tenuis TaxID=148309 RepID=A0AAD5NBT6_PARTN|nr:hypothetical protein KIN20_025361 [Parelaphostrongylus tenuis]
MGGIQVSPPTNKLLSLLRERLARHSSIKHKTTLLGSQTTQTHDRKNSEIEDHYRIETYNLSVTLMDDQPITCLRHELMGASGSNRCATTKLRALS